VDSWNGDSPKTGFRTYAAFPGQIIGTLAVVTVVACLLVWITATGRTGPGWAFTALWIAGLLWVGYWWLWRVAVRLELTDRTLEWRTEIRSGSIPIADIQAVRPSRMGPNLAVFDVSDGQPLMAITAKGFQAFLDDLAQQAPGLPISTSRMSSVRERWPGRGGYWSKR
jgi:hypothetical protein